MRRRLVLRKNKELWLLSACVIFAWGLCAMHAWGWDCGDNHNGGCYADPFPVTGTIRNASCRGITGVSVGILKTGEYVPPLDPPGCLASAVGLTDWPRAPGWILCGNLPGPGHNYQAGITYWRKDVAYCEQHCNGDADGDGVGNGVYDRCATQAGNAADGCLHPELDHGIDPLTRSICPLKGNPVSIYSGNKVESEVDLAFASSFGEGLVFKRFYNSRSETISALGYGWTHTYQLTLKINPSQVANHELVISDETGFGHFFSRFDETPVRIEALFSERSQLTLEAGSYVWKRPDGSAAAFDAASLRLIWLEDQSGNRQEIAWNTGVSPARIDTIADLASGRVLRFTYTGERLSAIHLYTGGVDRGAWVTYGHDARGNLTTVTYADGSGFRYEYNDTDNNPTLAPFSNNMTRKKNAANQELASWRYDDEDRCWFNATRDGRGVSIDYDGTQGQVIVTDAYGKSRTYTITRVNGRKRITGTSGDTGCTSCSEEVIRAAYDTNLNVTEKEYANGLIIRYANFDARGNPGTVTYAPGSPIERVLRFTYHPQIDAPLTRSETSLLNTQDAVSVWDYDADGNETANENPTKLVRRIVRKGYTRNAGGSVVAVDSVTRLAYNAKGQLVSIDGPLPGSTDTTGLSYDPATGDLLSVTRPIEGASTFANYTAAGRPQQITDANGSVFSYTYDGRNRVRTVTSQADSSTSTFDYNLAGDPSRVTAANGVSTDFEYDSTYGRLIRMLDPLGNYVSYGYDAQGNRIEESIYNPSAQRVFRKRFDFQSPQSPGKLWKEINPDDSFTQYAYDAVGNIQAVTDPAGKSTTYGYDVLKRLTAVTQPGAVQTLYGYNRYANLTSVRDAEGRLTAYEYDDLGRQLKTNSPDTGVTTYAYDSAGNLVSKTDANGVTTTYTYDALNRLTGIVYPDPAQSIAYTYDQGANGKGRLTGMSDSSGSTAYAYDARGNLTRETRTIGGVTYTTTYAYDAAGTLTGMTYPDGRSVAYVLDSAGRVSRVTTTRDGTTRVLADNIGHQPFGPVAGLTYGNGVSLTQNFDQLYRPAQISAGSLYSAGFTRNPAGNVTAIADNLDAARNQSFGYDDLYRLTSATGAYGTLGYTYDKTGNRLTETANGQTDTYGYAAGTSRLVQVAGASPKSYTLDANGNTTAAGSKSFTYNQNNRLIQAAEGGTQLAAYTYNGSGQRVIKEAAGNAAVVYHYDRFGNLIAESSLAGEFLAAYVYLNGARLAAITPQVAGELTVSVSTSKGRNLSGVNVYAFTEAGAYTGITAVTDAAGKAVFDPAALGAGTYKFRADYLGSQFWSEAVALPGASAATIQIAEETATIEITLGAAPATGVKVYLFTAGGAYLGLYQTADANGRASFDLPAGRQYKFRADYLGYQFWTDVVTAGPGLTASLTIAHQDVAITVNGSDSGDVVPRAGLKVYLFTPAGAYLGQNQTTDGNGQARFSLPAQEYKVRADYLGQQFWSEPFVQADKTVTIPEARAQVTVTLLNNPLIDVPVHVFTAAGAYLDLNAATAGNGQAAFRLPAGDYNFRADYLGSQYFSGNTTLIADQLNPITLSTGGGNLTLRVQETAGVPMAGITCHLFSASGAYLGHQRATSDQGEASFELADGSYKVRVDYLGYQFWTPVFAIPATATLSFDIPHEESVVTVRRDYNGDILPVQNVPVHLFTAAGTYQGFYENTDAIGESAFSLPPRDYKVRADFLAGQYWSEVFNQTDTTVTIPEGEAQITVTRGATSLPNVPVYVFTAAGSYLNVTASTDASGLASFILPAGTYKFRADYQGAQFWATQAVSAHQLTPVAINTGGGPFVLTVEKAPGAPLAGVPVYVFTSSGSYLNLTKQTDAQGQVSFELTDGAYKFRADYRGYQFWSAVSAVPGTLSGVLAIAHQDVAITVNEAYQASLTPLENIKVYLFTSAGAYQNINATTNAQGEVIFSLPQKDYKVRADYLGGQYWSPVFNAQNAAIDIAHGYANVQVSEHGAAVYNAPVYLFTNTGTYLGRMLRTDAAGLARFKLPAKAYKFRVDYNSRQYWSDVVNLLPNEETAVTLLLDLLALDSTNNPALVRVDGTPPRPEQKPWVPQKRVLLASLFEISGLLANAVVGQIPTEGGIYYFINDGLGTPQKIMDQSGAVVWSAVYTPFGNATTQVGGITNNLRLPGQYYDSETGLHYNWNRYYDPKAGRYLTADPIGLAGGVNLFGYANQDPVNYIDPDGQNPFLIAVAAAALLLANPDAGNAPGPSDVPIDSTGFQGMVTDSVLAASLGSLAGKLGSKVGGCFGKNAANGVEAAWDASRAAHIFRDAVGHVNPGTAASQGRLIRLFEQVASDSANLNMSVVKSPEAVKAGVQGFSKVFRNGEQIWVQVRNGRIIDAGVNLPGAVR